MIGVIVDLFQSAAIILWGIMMILVTRRVNRLNKRVDNQKFIKDYQTSRQIEDQPMCGCGHHQCFHDETGCGKTDTWIRYSDDASWQPCGCKRYTGPEQLPTVIP